MHLSRVLILALVATAAGCGGGGTNYTTVGSASPTAPPLAAQAAFAATTTTALATAPQSAGQIAIAVPTAGGFSGSIGLPVPGTIPPGTTLAVTLSNALAGLAAGAPPLSLGRAQAQALRATADAAPHSVLVYLQISSTSSITVGNAPSVTFTAPTQLPSAAYYLALYDSLRPSLGWQLGFEGPAAITTAANAPGSTLTFSPPEPAIPMTFTAFVPDTLAVYAVSPLAAAPTPAPAISPAAAPSAPPPFTLSTTTIALLATGATAASTIADSSGYTGTFGATSSAPAVASVAVNGKTVTVAAVSPGSATITVSDAQARTATIDVQVTTTTLPVQ